MITGHLIRFYGGATLFDLFWLQDLGHYTGDNMLHGWPNKDPQSNQITDQKISINADKKSQTYYNDFSYWSGHEGTCHDNVISLVEV